MKGRKSAAFRFSLSVALILLLIISLSLWFEIRTVRDVKKLTASLEQMRRLIEEKEYPRAQAACRSMRELWDSRKDHWYYYLNHTLIKETDLCITRIGVYLENGQYGDALAEEAALLRLLHEVKSHDLPLIHNII